MVSSVIQIELTPNHPNRHRRRVHSDGVAVKLDGRQTEQPVMSSQIEQQHPALAMNHKAFKFGALFEVVNLILNSKIINVRVQSKGETWGELQPLRHAE